MKARHNIKPARRILVVGTHPRVRQPSMSQFAEWLRNALAIEAAVALTTAPAIFLNRFTRAFPFAKWLGYIDQYLILPLKLLAIQQNYDLVVVADHSNSPATLLIPRSKVVVMVHDTIGLRQAKSMIPDAPVTGITGRILHVFILLGIKHARLLISNPGQIAEELRSLGVDCAPIPVGCALDSERFASPSKPPTSLLVGQSFFLNVAGSGWRKRKGDLLELWKHVAHNPNPPKLVLAGFTPDDLAREIARSGLAESVIVLNNVTNAQLKWLYTNCRAVITASHEEGFCIPVIEAFYFNKPVLTPSRATFYSSIFGSAVDTIALEDPAQGAKQIASLMQSLRADAPAEARSLLEWWSMRSFGERVRSALLPQ